MHWKVINIFIYGHESKINYYDKNKIKLGVDKRCFVGYLLYERIPTLNT